MRNQSCLKPRASKAVPNLLYAGVMLPLGFVRSKGYHSGVISLLLLVMVVGWFRCGSSEESACLTASMVFRRLPWPRVRHSVRLRFPAPLQKTASGDYCMYASMWIVPVAKFTVPTPQTCRLLTHP
jgi:hypothetical protein